MGSITALLSQIYFPDDLQIAVKWCPLDRPWPDVEPNPHAVKGTFSFVGGKSCRASPGMSGCVLSAQPGQDFSAERHIPSGGLLSSQTQAVLVAGTGIFWLPRRGDLCHLKINTTEMMQRVVQLLLHHGAADLRLPIGNDFKLRQCELGEHRELCWALEEGQPWGLCLHRLGPH